LKLIRITSTGILSLVIGISAPAYAQHDQQGDKQDRHEKQQDKHQQAKPEAQHKQQHGQDQGKRPDHARQQQGHDQNSRSEHPQKQQRHDQTSRQEHAQQQDQNSRQQQARRSPEQQRIQHSAWQRHGSHNWESEHRTWQQRGGYHGYRIPDDRFRVYFGSNHGFRIYGRPFLIVGGYPRFQYQGYWFSPVDPWPEYWGSSWYDNDEVYVNYVDNGYYLYNRRYPDVGIAISISM
jgi:hypothetical protein